MSAVCLLLCALLGVLWARSYRSSDTLLGLKRNTGLGVGFVSEKGQLIGVWNSPVSSLLPISEWTWRSVPTNTMRRHIESRFGFSYVSNRRETGIAIPHWLPVTLLLALVAIPWPKWQYSLRMLLLAMTLVAIVLGAVIGT